MKVLVADDELLIRYTLKAALADAGHEPVEAADGSEVLRALEDDVPEVLVLDLMMPVKTGYDVLAWLRENDRLRRLPVIILSGFVVDPEEFEHDAHVVAVLQKPLYMNQLMDALQRCEDHIYAA